MNIIVKNQAEWDALPKAFKECGASVKSISVQMKAATIKIERKPNGDYPHIVIQPWEQTPSFKIRVEIWNGSVTWPSACQQSIAAVEQFRDALNVAIEEARQTFPANQNHSRESEGT